MTATIIVQARMTSTRLPGKVLKPIAGKPMMSYLLERLRRVTSASRIVVATTSKSSDDVVSALCKEEGIDSWRGSEDDVLARYAQCIRHFHAQTVVRVTADCPLLDPELVDMAVSAFDAAAGSLDYLSNMLEPTWPYGMAVEVTSGRVLLQADAEARDPEEREHVTPFIYRRPQRYRLHSLTRSPNLSHLRWTVDTPEDFELVRRILEALYPINREFRMNDVLALLEQHPDWLAINHHITQKPLAGATRT